MIGNNTKLVIVVSLLVLCIFGYVSLSHGQARIAISDNAKVGLLQAEHKLDMAQKDEANAQTMLQTAVNKAFADAGLDKASYVIDLDKLEFVNISGKLDEGKKLTPAEEVKKAQEKPVHKEEKK